MSYAAKLTKCEAEISLLTAELAAMRERCERQVTLIQAFYDLDNDREPEEDPNVDKRFHAAEDACLEHGDLTPPKETSDG